MRARGHECHCFTICQSGIRSNRVIGPLLGLRRFQGKVRDCIRREGDHYDVIQVEHNLLRYPRPTYSYRGLLVSKSVGLAHFYDDYERHIERPLRAERGDRGTFAGRIVRGLGKVLGGGLRVVENGFEVADQIHLNNSDEFDFLTNQSRWRSKAVLMPSGLSEAERDALAASHHIARRLASTTVLFLGHWSYRKGKAEMPAIVRQVREKRPDARFRLLGTGAAPETILPQFHVDDRPHIEVVPRFERTELPGWLQDIRVAFLPTYMEGFPFACLELLAAGLPLVSWDVPGVREMLREISPSTMFPPSDADATAAGVVRWLGESAQAFEAQCENSRRVAALFQWEEIAKTYERAVMRQAETHPHLS